MKTESINHVAFVNDGGFILYLVLIVAQGVQYQASKQMLLVTWFIAILCETEGNISADKLTEEAPKLTNFSEAKSQTKHVRSQIEKGVSSFLRGIALYRL